MRFFLAIAILFLSFPVVAQAENETAYDRVMRTGVVRCGYALWPGYLDIDPNTNEKSGIWYEYMNHVGELLDLKIKWVEEVAYSEIGAGLNASRYDVFCSGLWQDVTQLRGMDFTTPITFQAIMAVVRDGDKRFDNNLKALNDPAIKVATIDDDMSELIYQQNFPKGEVVSMPRLTAAAQMFTNIVTKKADVTFTSPETVLRFNENNVEKLHIVEADKPLRVFAEVLAVKLGEEKLRSTLSYATFELLNRGTIDEILDKYEIYPGSFYRVAKPYEVPR